MPLPPPLIVHPDAELAVTSFLRQALAGRAEGFARDVQVGTKLPAATGPARNIMVRRVGGAATTLVTDTARVDLLIWHEDDQQRMQLAQLARGLLHTMAGTTTDQVWCRRVDDVAGPTRLPDPADPSRQIVLCTVEVTLRGLVLAV